MLKTLKFVQGAVAKKDFVSAMTHFAIEGGRVRSYNGSIALCSPIAFDIDCKPKANMLVKVISMCNDIITLSLTETGKLRVESGKFKAFVDCIQEETPHVEPEGELFYFNGEMLMKAFETIAPFVGEDASRPWCNGILLKDQSAFATNNVCLIQYWMGIDFPHVVNVPLIAIEEMLRIKEAPTHGQIAENSITFHYNDGRWIRAQLLSAEWPDLNKVLGKETQQKPIDPILFEGLEYIKPFADKIGRVYIDGGLVSTTFEKLDGALYEVPGIDWSGVYRIEMLQLLKGVAKTCDFDQYPSPAVFFGDGIRGAIIGMRV